MIKDLTSEKQSKLTQYVLDMTPFLHSIESRVPATAKMVVTKTLTQAPKMPCRKYPRRGFKITPQRGHA